MKPLPSKISLFQYSFLALPLAFAGLPLYIHAPDFYTRDLGLSIGLLGTILLVIRLFDAFQDPIIGYISDKYSTHRPLIMLSGVIMLITGIAAIFYGPQLYIPIAVWFTLSMILATSGFSIVSINMNMIGGFWVNDPKQRTTISAWREAVSLIGLLVASILPTVLILSMTAEESFHTLVWIFTPVCLLSFLLFWNFLRKIPSKNLISKNSKTERFSFFKILISDNRHFWGICFLTHLASALPAVLVLFFIRDYLGANTYAGFFLLIYFLSGSFLMFSWVKMSKKIGKEKTWMISMLLSVATFMWAYFLQSGDVIAYACICAFSGAALGADLALPPSIIADRVSKQKNENQATQHYAVLAFIPKIAIAIASGVSLLILDFLNFTAGIQNSEQALKGLIILYALVPCIIKLIAAFYLWQLNKKEGNTYEYFERSPHHGSNDIS